MWGSIPAQAELELRAIAFTFFAIGAVISIMTNRDGAFIMCCIGICFSLMRYRRDA